MITDEELKIINSWANRNNLGGKRVKGKYIWGIDAIETEPFKNKIKWDNIRRGIPRDKETLLKITCLNLDNYKLSDIPKELWKLTQLTHINLARNSLSSGLDGIEDLENLDYLDLSKNAFFDTPTNILNLKSLRYLSLSNNSIMMLPSEFSKLVSLVSLDLNSNNRWYHDDDSEMDSLNDIRAVGNLVNLKFLDLHSCYKLNDIPAEIGNLKQLEFLDLSSCEELVYLPKEIGNLSNLKVLDLRYTSLDKLPVTLSNLTNLEMFNGEPYIKFNQNKNEKLLTEKTMTDSDDTTDKKTFTTQLIGNPDFFHKNILLKGVPGTGKSRAIEKIIKNKLKLEDHKENILRINIHSASSNADLMQGIGISSHEGQIEYKEKRGLILNLIEKATFHPQQPFVLILEEIQENSLNELIGDLIYLIAEDKRAKNIMTDDKEYTYQELIEKIIEKNPQTAYVEIPYLVDDSTKYRKMIMPDNLYIFCTSNYRDDKKVIEDNLLRRFEVLEIYPKSNVVHKSYRNFFEKINENILKVLEDEMHPDRFLIGHSNWIIKEDKEKDIDTQQNFYRTFLKVVVEFKDVKEIEFGDFKKIVQKLPLVEEMNLASYKSLIEDLQSKAGYDFLD